MAMVRPAHRPRVTSHGGDAGGEDPDRPRRLPLQCDEAGTTTGSKRKGRKSNKLIALDQARLKNPNKKIPVEFDEGGTWKAVGDEAAHFNNSIGIIVRNLLKPYFFNWTDQLSEDVKLIWPQINSIFEMKDIPEVRETVLRQSKRSLSEWKNDLNNHYKNILAEYGEEKVKQTPHLTCDMETWNRYLTHRNSERFQSLSKKNKENYDKKLTKPTHGAQSFAAYRHRKKNAQGQIQSPIDNYQERHMKKNKWTTKEAKARYEKMSQVKDSQATQDPESRLSDEVIMSQVIKSKGRHRTGIGPTLRKSALQGNVTYLEPMVPLPEFQKAMQFLATTLTSHGINVDGLSTLGRQSPAPPTNTRAEEDEEEEDANLSE